MKSKFQQRDKAIALRKDGMSFREILKLVPVAKSTLSRWLQFLELSEIEQKQLEERTKINADNGREKAALSNRNKRIQREDLVLEEARILYNRYENDPIFILGIGLYWAEGSKRTSVFQFMNSDVNMIKCMIYWVEKYLEIQSNKISLRIHTHLDFKAENYEHFWSQNTGIPLAQFKKTIYKPNKHGIFKKNPHYKGCARIEVSGGIAILRKMIFLKRILENKLEML